MPFALKYRFFDVHGVHTCGKNESDVQQASENLDRGFPPILPCSEQNAAFISLSHRVGWQLSNHCWNEAMMGATLLTTDEVVISTCSRKVRTICAMLKSLNLSIREYDAELEQLVKQHADRRILYC